MIRKLVVSQLGEIKFSAVNRSVFTESAAAFAHRMAETAAKITTKGS